MTQTDNLAELVSVVNEYAQKSVKFKNIVFTAGDFTKAEADMYCELKEKAENAWWESETHPDNVELAQEAKKAKKELDTFVSFVVTLTSFTLELKRLN